MGARAIITAGASGIGLTVAKRLVADGFKVAICDVNRDALEQVKKSVDLVFADVADVTDPEAMNRFVADASIAMGGLDTVIANAGIGGPTALLEDIAPNDWKTTLSVNLDGQFNLLRSAIPYLKSSGSGSVVLMSSVAGRLGYPMRSPYAVAKWGVIGLKETLAMELGPFGVTVNAILPGSVSGERIERVLRDKATATGTTTEEAYDSEVANVSMHKMVEADEVAGIIAFLTSAAGRSISGQSIGICGNYETLR